MIQGQQDIAQLHGAAALCLAFGAERSSALLGVLLTLPVGVARADIRGKVLDELTNQPIAGAVVVVEWHAKPLMQALEECLHVETAVTDVHGRYEVHSWAGAWAPGKLASYYGRFYRYVAYKFNYVPGFHPGDAEGVLRLKPFTGTSDEWFEPKDTGYPVGETNWFGYRMYYRNCWDQGSQHNLFRLYDTFAKDAAVIAKSPLQKRYVARVNEFAQNLLVNWSKRTHVDRHGNWVNDDPADAYTPEMLLK